MRRDLERLQRVDVQAIVDAGGEHLSNPGYRAEEPLGVQEPTQPLELTPPARAEQLLDGPLDARADSGQREQSVAALLLAAPSSASAYWPYGGCGYYGYGCGYGYGWNNPSYFNGGIYASPLPYYAEFPPVYYSSQITARHYGASPFAWCPGQSPITYVPMPEPRPVAMPQMIENPYVGGPRPAGAAPAAPTSIEPQKIDNPFVASK